MMEEPGILVEGPATLITLIVLLPTMDSLVPDEV